jgi:multisubunit Na+/H+ antiporter MnhF subunit
MTFDRGIEVLIAVLAISLALCFVRLYLGPNVPNRALAFDTIAVHAVGILALLGLRGATVVMLDIAIVTAVLGFLGTTMMAIYLERSARPRDAAEEDTPALQVEPD